MKILSFLMILFLLSFDVLADPLPTTTSDEFWLSFDQFFLRLSNLVTILTSPGSDLYAFVKMLMVFFSVISLVFFTIRFISNGITEIELVFLILSIFVPTLILNYYDQLTSGAWRLFLGISDSIQVAAIGNSAKGGIFGFLDVLWTNVILDSGNPYRPGGIIDSAIIFFVFWLLNSLFMAGVALATMWSVWGYAIAKIVGIIFIPFSILPATRYLAFNWLGVFLGFLIYSVIARINMVLVYLLTITIFNLPINSASASSGALPVYIVDISKGFPVTLFILLLVGVLSMLSVGSMASSLVGGGSSISSGMGRMALKRFLR